MFDWLLLKEKLEQILEALITVQRRFSKITTPDDFIVSDHGLDMLDAIAMLLIAIGKNFKKIDKETNGSFLKKYPNIDWRGVKGIRDVLSHDYFNIDHEEIYNICESDLLPLIETVHIMIKKVDWGL
ncbi:MAG: DUF86 domain-containing protein [Desulfobacterales bacterium]|nr:DUF86 domain-containing protein [Desulfobacterales bacterium]